MDKCFCHLNGYKVKDADARRMLSGEASMGDIKVSGIKSANLFNFDNIINKTHSRVIINGVADNFTLSSNRDTSYDSVTWNLGIIDYNKIYYSFNTDVTTSSQYGYIMVSPDGTFDNKVNLFEITDTNNSVDLSEYQGQYLLVLFRANAKTVYVSQTITNLIVSISEISKYSPYFELATKDDLKNVSPSDVTVESKGYYSYSMPMGVCPTATNGEWISTNLDAACYPILKEIIDKLTADDIHRMTLVIENTSENIVVDGTTVPKGSPSHIVFDEFNYFEDTFNGIEGHFYSFTGCVTPSRNSNNQLSYETKAEMTVSVNNLDGSYEIVGCTLALTTVKYLPTANTEEYIPTGDYNPATKKYVDDKVKSIENGTSSGSSSSSNVIKLVTNTSVRTGYNDGTRGNYSGLSFDNTSLINIGNAITEAYAKGITAADYLYQVYSDANTIIRMRALNDEFYETNIQSKPNKLYLASDFREFTASNYNLNKVANTYLVLNLSWNGNICTCTSAEGRSYQNEVITARNLMTKGSDYFASKTSTSMSNYCSAGEGVSYNSFTFKEVGDVKYINIDATLTNGIASNLTLLTTSNSSLLQNLPRVSKAYICTNNENGTLGEVIKEITAYTTSDGDSNIYINGSHEGTCRLIYSITWIK